MKLFKVVIILILIMIYSSGYSAVEGEQKQVLVLIFYDIRDQWSATVLEGIASALAGNDIQLHVEQLDARRHQSESYLHEFNHFLKTKYADTRLDLAIVVDNAAFDLILRIRPELRSDLPVIFCGVNNFTPDMISGQNNITGVNEVVDILGTVNLALRIFPNSSRVVVVASSSGIGAINLEIFRKSVPAFSRKVDILELYDVTVASLAETMGSLPRNSILLRLDNLRQPDDSSIPLQQSISLLSAGSHSPVFSLWDFDMGHGALGGLAVSGLAQGRKAGELALLALQDHQIESIPVVMESPNVPMFDYIQMQRFKVEMSMLPNNTVIVNMQKSFYDRYNGFLWTVATVITIMSGCIAALILTLLSRRKAQVALQASEERYRAYVDSAPSGIFIADAKGRYLDVNPEACRLTGYEKDELLSMAIPDLLPPESFTQGQKHFARINTDGQATDELRYRRKDGEVRWWSVSATRLSTDRFLGFVTDVTDRHHQDEARSIFLELLDNADHVVVFKDPSLRYVMVNRAYTLLTGLSLNDVTGKTDRENFAGISTQAQIDAYIEYDRQALTLPQGQSISVEEGTLAPDDSVRTFLSKKFPVFSESGRLLGVGTITWDITERKRVEESLRIREHELRLALERLHAHLENSPLAAIEWDSELRISRWSSIAEKFFGWNESEVIGKKWSDWNFVHDEDLHHVNSQVMCMVEGINSHNVILNRNYTKDGRVLYCKWYNSTLKDDNGRIISILSQVENFTDFFRALEAQADSEHRLRELFEHMNSGVAVYEAVDDGQDFVIREFNPMAEKITNLSQQQAIGQRLLDLFPHMDRTGLLSTLRKVWLTGQDAHIAPFYYQDQIRRGWRENSIYKLPKGEIVAIFDDVTERMRTLHDLQAAKEQAEAANRAKSEFLANMSHELRTPMNGVMGILQIMDASVQEPEQAGLIDMALQSCRRLTRLLGDILDLSRIEADKLDLTYEPFCLRDTFRAVDQIFRPAADQAGITLRFQLDPTIHGRVKGDPIRMQQLLNNLVGNALKFTPHGEVALEGISINPQRKGKRLFLFSISDTGIGIPDDRLNALFEPFTQVEGSYTRKFQGAGLGLSIVKRLVRLMNGTMCVASEVGVGSTFHVCIPFDVEESDAITEPKVSYFETVNHVNRKILLAEDDEMSAMIVVKHLRRVGLMVFVVNDGKQALDFLRDRDPELILMDVQMPVMDGVEATRRIRAGEAGEDKADIPIIALTAYAMAGDREKFLEAGMNGYLAKPVEIDELLKVIDESISNPKLRI